MVHFEGSATLTNISLPERYRSEIAHTPPLTPPHDRSGSDPRRAQTTVSEIEEVLPEITVSTRNGHTYVRGDHPVREILLDLEQTLSVFSASCTERTGARIGFSIGDGGGIETSGILRALTESRERLESVSRHRGDGLMLTLSIRQLASIAAGHIEQLSLHLTDLAPEGTVPSTGLSALLHMVSNVKVHLRELVHRFDENVLRVVQSLPREREEG